MCCLIHECDANSGDNFHTYEFLSVVEVFSTVGNEMRVWQKKSSCKPHYEEI